MINSSTPVKNLIIINSRAISVENAVITYSASHSEMLEYLLFIKSYEY